MRVASLGLHPEEVDWVIVMDRATKQCDYDGEYSVMRYMLKVRVLLQLLVGRAAKHPPSANVAARLSTPFGPSLRSGTGL